MTKEEFILKFNKSQKVVHTENIIIQEPIEFSSHNYNAIYSFIENVTFEHDVTFHDLDLETSFTFEKCIFKGNLYFIDCKIKTHKTVNSCEIRFSNCDIDYLMIDNLQKLRRGIEIYNTKIKSLDIINLNLPEINLTIKFDKDKIDNFVKNIFIDLVAIKELYIKNIKTNVIDIKNNFEEKGNINSINIEKCEINEKIDVENLSINYLELRDNQINGWVRLYFIQSISLSLVKNICKDKFIITCSHFKDSIGFNDGVYSDTFEIVATKIERDLSIIGANFSKDFNVRFLQEAKPQNIIGVCNRIWIENSNFSTSININTQSLGTKINQIDIRCSLSNTGTINVNNCEINKTSIMYENHKGNINFNSVFFQFIKLEKFANYGNLTFASCKAIEDTESTFLVENSNLGKTQFYDFDFDSFSNIDIKNAVLTEIVTANVTWFLPEKLNQTKEKKDEKYYKNQREIYRQLKQSTDKQGDRIQSLDFQAEEMKVYKASLRKNRKASQNDKWILWISQSNNFGLSWLKPTWILLLITFFSYILLVASARLYFNFQSGSVYTFFDVVFYENFAVFFQLFNPTRDLSKLFPNITLSAWVHFLDISHRLIFGFFIFQIASGFRKYVK